MIHPYENTFFVSVFRVFGTAIVAKRAIVVYFTFNFTGQRRLSCRKQPPLLADALTVWRTKTKRRFVVCDFLNSLVSHRNRRRYSILTVVELL